ncbi:MAG: ATP/GTP-binding protein [Acidilobus sp.]|nr:ATP/GTP-binding protein [Acidilobus sp.]
MRFIVIVGPAGSGKSTLTAQLSSAMESQGASVVKVNFDPAADKPPYDPDVDVRDYVTVEEFIDKGLGPNGAMVSAVDAIIGHVDKIRQEVEEFRADYVIIDTPGQLEPFAYRAGGPLVLDALIQDDKSLVVFLMDAVFFEDPVDIVSILTLASSVNVRFKRPQLNVISKADLLPPDVLNNVVERLHEEGYLEDALRDSRLLRGLELQLSMSLARALYEAGYVGQLLPVSAYDEASVRELYGKVQEVLEGGEDYRVYDVDEKQDED